MVRASGAIGSTRGISHTCCRRAAARAARQRGGGGFDERAWR